MLAQLEYSNVHRLCVPYFFSYSIFQSFVFFFPFPLCKSNPFLLFHFLSQFFILLDLLTLTSLLSYLPLPSLPSLPSLTSLSSLASLPSLPSLTSLSSLASLPSLPSLTSLPSLASLLSLSSLTSLQALPLPSLHHADLSIYPSPSPPLHTYLVFPLSLSFFFLLILYFPSILTYLPFIFPLDDSTFPPGIFEWIKVVEESNCFDCIY